MTSPKRYTITAALPYTNGPVHIGHLAGVYVPADIYARYQRLRGQDVAFVCGSDEHGVPITLKAKKEGVAPQQIVDKYHAMIKKSFEEFGISFDNYSRTSAAVHHKTASDFFKKMYEEGKFIEQSTEQFYDEASDQFLADRFIVGTCPKCGYEESYGDQCENCGTSHNATDLINPKSAISGNKPVLRETKHWFLPLDQYDGWLKEWIVKGKKDSWKPNVYGQCKSWIDDGLRPRAVTRDLDWGIPVPVEGAEGKVLYVWFDAPIGYISSTKEWAEEKGIDWEPYWKDASTKLLHFIGKDNIVFHCIMFPCMLKAEGSYILPDNVPANEFLNLEGNKISTSKNWAVWLHEFLEEFPGQQDVLRYVLTANAPETKDNDFTWADFQARNNSELVAVFGNFINRVVTLTHKYYDGVVPAKGQEFDEFKLINEAPKDIADSLEKYRFREALMKLMNLARAGNQFLQEQEPWKKIKESPEEVEGVMFTALQIAAALAALSEPFLPHTSEKLNRMLRVSSSGSAEGGIVSRTRTPADEGDSPSENRIENGWDDVATKSDLLPTGHLIGEGQLLFSKIEDEQIQQQLEKLQASKAANEASNAAVEPQKDMIQFDDFTKLDIRVGTILEAEKMPKTKKLMVIKVDTGIDVRTVVSGIAESYTAEEIIGKRVTVLVNLAPRPLRGVESQGMILMTETPDGKLVFVNPDEDGVDNGATIN